MSATLPVPTTNEADRKVFLWTAAATVVLVVGFVAWTVFRVGGVRVTIGVDDIGEAVAAFIAAACCGVAASRSSGRQQLGWWLLSASAGAWGLGEVAWSVYEVGLGMAVPFPSLADVGFLGAIPLAAAGILAFTSNPQATATRLGLWFDGGTVFLALTLLAWTLGLKTLLAQIQGPPLDKVISLAYPVSDIVIGTIVVVAIRRAPREVRGRLLLLLGGLAANSIADSAFAYLTANGTYGAIGSVLDAGWVIGYLMIGLAALWPWTGTPQAKKEQPIEIWQVVLPWLAILTAGVSAIVLAITTGSVDLFLTAVVVMIALLVMASQVYAQIESRALLVGSRLDAATLNDIILHAPLGVARLGSDMNIIQANPQFVALLGRPEHQVIGAPLTSFLPPAEVARTADQFRSLADGSAGAIHTETEVVRDDGTTMLLQWSATAVHNPDGEAAYFIGMFNDATATEKAATAARGAG